MVARIIPIRPVAPADALREIQPDGAQPLETGCDWGNCGRKGWGWRFDRQYDRWLVVCRRCSKKR